MSNKEQIPTNLMVALVTMTSTEDVKSNLEFMQSCLSDLSSKIDLVVFPENAAYMRLSQKFIGESFSADDPRFSDLEVWSKKNNCAILFGAPEVSHAQQRPFNSLFFISPEAPTKVVYRKIHLFDVEVDGHKPVRESDQFTPGEEPSILQWRGWDLGLSICYDLRFSSLYEHYALREVDAVVIPSAFLVPTGQAHWKTLVRARAIETQSFVLAPAQGGEHKGEMGHIRKTYGHSLVIDPWGQVLAEGEPDKGVLIAELEAAKIKKVRQQIPTLSHRREFIKSSNN